MIVSWSTADDRFHTDQQLQEIFGVSRATVRQALAELEAEGLLRRRQGFGTFVNRNKIEESFAARADFSGQWAESGRSLSVTPVAVQAMPCPPEFARALRLQPGDEVLGVERLRLSGAMRIAWDRRYIPMSIGADIPRKEFEKVSLLEVLGQRAVLERGDTEIEASIAGREFSEQLQIDSLAPVLIRSMTYFTVTGEPVLAGVSVYRADQVRYKFSSPLQLPGSSVGSDVLVKSGQAEPSTISLTESP
ncbi:GntR family transcriptional regulator [soil metagenome]